MSLRDMCPDCQRPYSVHGHGGEGENTYPACPPDLRDELAEVTERALDEDLPADPTRAELQAACVRAADATLPIIERETTLAPVDLTYLSDRARAYVIGLEARVRELREQNDELRAKLAGAFKPDERHLKKAYRDGYAACAAEVAEKSRGLMDALGSARAAGLDAYGTAWKAEPESTKNGEPR